MSKNKTIAERIGSNYLPIQPEELPQFLTHASMATAAILAGISTVADWHKLVTDLSLDLLKVCLTLSMISNHSTLDTLYGNLRLAINNSDQVRMEQILMTIAMKLNAKGITTKDLTQNIEALAKFDSCLVAEAFAVLYNNSIESLRYLLPLWDISGLLALAQNTRVGSDASVTAETR